MYKFSTYKADGDTCGIKNIEIDSKYFKKPIEELCGADICDARERLIEDMEHIVLYTCETSLSDKSLEALFVNARALNCEAVTFKAVPQSGWEYALRLSVACRVKLWFVVNESFGFEEYGKLRGENTGIIYDPAEFVRAGKNPYLSVLYKNRYKDDVKMLRFTDALYESCEPTLPEYGNSEIRECASTLLSRSFDGYFSIVAFKEDLKAPIAEVKRILSEM